MALMLHLVSLCVDAPHTCMCNLLCQAVVYERADALEQEALMRLLAIKCKPQVGGWVRWVCWWWVG